MTSADTPASPDSPPRVLAVVGPTAVGKTAVAEELAVRLGGEIVSADSMQVYRGMDIGTAKPAPAERRVKYHCLDLAEPGEAFSAALYQIAAREAISHIAGRGVLPVVAGGTGLYVRAALDSLEFPAGEQLGNAARARYEAIAAKRGPEALHALLAERDPASAAVVHANNVRRVVRALEMADEGVSYAEQREGFSARDSVYSTRFIGLTMDRPRLYERIDARVDAMVAAGLLDEVRELLGRGLREALTASQAIGYKEFVPVIEGGVEIDTAVSEVKQASRRYAKRQLTWFAADPRVRWIDVTELTISQAAEAAMGTLDW
ncbi:MAG: tRNA (adenosine(37)-N6)-dimethylallyltransferase MiaA [Coriobacteriia bacterium]|nr:tRNA (adenosine(37)-N6)-dimethylallyltransferase MiaA [Coriobacteriia bacterium]